MQKRSMSRTNRKERRSAKSPVRKERVRALRRNVKVKIKLGVFDNLPQEARPSQVTVAGDE
jgi:hypothetical protein